MPVTFTSIEIINLLESYLWSFFRIAGLVMAAPIIGTRMVPVRIRLVLALASNRTRHSERYVCGSIIPTRDADNGAAGTRWGRLGSCGTSDLSGA